MPMCPISDNVDCVTVVIDTHTCEDYGMVTLDEYTCWGSGTENILCCEYPG